MSITRAFLASAIFLLLVSPLSFAACPSAIRQIRVAAVTGENEGGIFTLVVEVHPGNGTIYTSISPMMGYSTQESEKQAADYAFASTGMDLGECDVLFHVGDAFGQNKVDGPSAGGAMAVALRAALLGKPIRQDVVMTGTISQGGRIGDVGGVIEKSTAAASTGAHYILVPSLQVYESYLLSSVSGTHNFTAIEVKNISDAERILFSSQSAAFTHDFSPKSKPLPPLLPEQKYDADLGRFSIVATDTVDSLEDTVQEVFQIAPKTQGSEALSSYFSDEIAKYRALISMGYPFTAANAAFLLSIDAQYVRLGSEGPDIDSGIETVSSCISSLEAPQKTRQNFHWATGADLRRIWAKSKLNQSIEFREDQGGYLTLRDLYFAYSWCKISQLLSEQANDIGGDPIDESALASLADEKLSRAIDVISSSPAENYDAGWHLQNGIDANRSGQYGAAIYEATYAQNAQEISNGAAGGNASAAIESLLAENRTSLWGKIYHGQGKFIYYDSKEGGFSPTDSFTVLRYSGALDSSAGGIDRVLSGKNASIGTIPFTQIPLMGQGRQKGEYGAVVAAVASFALGFLSAAALFRASQKSKRK
jgi:hypothetical protein